MNTETKREQNWTLPQYVAYLRDLNSKANEIEIDLVVCLMRLEKKEDLWRVWGLESFAQAFNDTKYLGLSISSLRYENVKKAIREFGEAKVRRWGLPAARRARKLQGTDRVRYVQRVEEIREKYQRPLSDQSASGVFREVAPPQPANVSRDPDAVKIRRLEKELEAACAREDRLQERVEVLQDAFEKAKAWAISAGVKNFPWRKILLEARMTIKAGTKRQAA